MDYEKLYNEALERAKGMCALQTDKATMEYVFHELRESEDERIIEGFKNLLKRIKDSGGLTLNMVPVERCEAWLEKQKEQKPVEWSEEDDQLIGFIFDLLNSLVWRKEWAMDKKECLERLKSLRPSWKPSEWQMSMLLAVINDPNNAGSESCYLTLKSIYEQLKKLM